MTTKINEVNNMYCSNCGALLGESIRKFCEFCGFELNLQVKRENIKREDEPIKENKSQKSSRRRCC